MDIVLLFHSLNRFAILLVAITGLVVTLVTLLRKQTPTQMDKTLGSIFLGLYDLQMLLGLLIILLGGLTQAIHPVVMFVGLVIAHGLQNMTKRAEGSRALLTRIALYIVPLAVILIGLATISHLPT